MSWDPVSQDTSFSMHSGTASSLRPEFVLHAPKRKAMRDHFSAESFDITRAGSWVQAWNPVLGTYTGVISMTLISITPHFYYATLNELNGRKEKKRRGR